MGVCNTNPIMEERQMAKARKRARQRRRAKSLIGSMREFLTPAVFKQVRNASKRRKSPRWDLHPLLYILLLTTYCCGDSLPEKFEAAKEFYVVCCPKRKRPGEVFCGIREGGREAAHAGPADVGGGDSRTVWKRSSAIGGRWEALFPSAAMARGKRVREPRNWSDAWGPSAKRVRRR